MRCDPLAGLHTPSSTLGILVSLSTVTHSRLSHVSLVFFFSLLTFGFRSNLTELMDHRLPEVLFHSLFIHTTFTPKLLEVGMQLLSGEVSLHVCTGLCRCVHSCRHMWRSEVDVRMSVFFSQFFTFPFETRVSY